MKQVVKYETVEESIVMTNPFNPSFGKRPTHFYGRQEITRSIISSVEDINSPWRTTLITGIRGSGKTALLSDIRKNMNNNNIIVLYIVPNDAILDSVLTQLYRQQPKTITGSAPELKSVSVNLGLSVNLEKNMSKPNFTESFSYQIMEMIDNYMKHGKHVTFLIDEAQKHTEDMRIFISIYQDLVMQEYSVSMVLTGLPTVISDILNDDILTFLRRSKQIELENVELMIVEHEFKKVFLKDKAPLTKELVSKAAISTYGYPYLIQLIGFYLWEETKNINISYGVLEDVLLKSKAELFRNVHRVIFADLSSQDKEFLYAMSEDDKISSVSDIGKRMKKEKNYISKYRERLLSAGVVKSVGHGLLRFNYPYMREFLNQMKNEFG